MITHKTLIPLLLLAASCATPVEYRYARGGPELIKNEQGHVVGQKEMLRDATTGEMYENIVYFTPRRDESGKIIGYEEPMAPGTVLRDVNGRRVGVKYSDLRSRGTNTSEGVTVIITKPDEE
ncbi:MAG TPA: hypothetical protein VEU32_11340 [Burkholderiales bacterium]|nr:hypothetical protein [Burkholderiales bacterium]